MITLGEHNNRLIEYERTIRNLRKAGVACDNCKTELVYEDDQTLTTDPPKRRVRCPSCEFRGFKLG